MSARYTEEDLERAVREAAEHGARAALAKLAPPSAPPPLPSPPLPAWCSVEEYARHIGKAPKTVRGYAQRAPAELAVKYGRDWRIAGPAFDAWVRRGGPFRVHDDGQVH